MNKYTRKNTVIVKQIWDRIIDYFGNDGFKLDRLQAALNEMYKLPESKDFQKEYCRRIRKQKIVQGLRKIGAWLGITAAQNE